MERASPYLVTAFFFTFPLVFGGVPAFFGGELPRGIFLYEGVRLAWFVLWAGIFLAFLPIRRILRDPKFPNWQDGSVIASAVAIGFFILTVSVHPSAPISDVLFGRTYSAVAVLATVIVACFFSAASREARKSVLRAMVMGFVAFNLPYATAQVFGFDPVAALVTFPDWWEGRAFWTLGNPNSLAFFATLCFPVVFWVFPTRTVRWAWVSALTAIVLFSQSLSAFVVCLAYVGYRVFGLRAIVAVSAIALAAFFVSVRSHPEKFFSVQTRMAIAGDVLERIVANPKTLLLGDGSGSVERLFSTYRSAEVMKFVGGDAPIDRTHLVWLDMALVFGTPFSVSVLVLLIFSAMKNPERSARGTFGIFLVLSAVHTPGVAEWSALVAVLLANVRKRG